MKTKKSGLDMRSAWIEIDSSAVRHNFRRIQQASGTGKVLAVVKDNAYGHGAVEISRVLSAEGVFMLGVSSPGEALELKVAGIKVPVLVLSPLLPEDAEKAVRLNVRTAVDNLAFAQALNRSAQKQHRKVFVHLKVDTGMCRFGVQPEDVLVLAQKIYSLPGIVLEGVFTHLAAADMPDNSMNKEQMKKFTGIIQELKGAGIEFPLCHAANSSAIAFQPEFCFNVVRPGLALYGLGTSEAMKQKLGIKPVLSLKAKVMSVRDILPGCSISYGATFTAEKAMKIAVAGIGYGDGYNRLLSNKGEMLIKGSRVRIIGRVCMDQTMVDVSDVASVKPGDEVVVIGTQGKEKITAEDIAEKVDTISYEVVCNLNQRLRRCCG